jgi:hypothetical protein
MNKTIDKINYLKQIAIDEYNIRDAIITHAADKAAEVNKWAINSHFMDTDVFMSEGGIFVLVAYKDENSIEITILDDGTFDIFIESDRTKLFYKQHQSEYYIQTKLGFWGRIWDLSGLYQESVSTLERNDPMRLPSSDASPEGFQYLNPIVSNLRVMNPVGS